MLYATIILFISVTPFAVWQGFGDGIRFPKEFLSILGLIAIVAMSFRHNIKPAFNKWLWGFMAWCWVATWINNFPISIAVADKVALQMPAPMIAWKELFYIALTCMTISCIGGVEKMSNPKSISFANLHINFLDRPIDDQIRSILNIVNWCMIVMSAYAVIQWLGFDNVFRAASQLGPDMVAKTNTDPSFSVTHRVVGTIGNPSLMSIWIAMCLPISLLVGKIRGLIGFILGGTVLIITAGASGIVSALAGLIFWAWFKTRRRGLLLVFLILLFGFCSFLLRPHFTSLFNPTGRIEVHKIAWDIIKQRPWFGWGLGTFEYIIGGSPQIVQLLKNEHWRELHDEFGQIWFSTGGVGLIIFLGMILSFFRDFLRKITDTSLALMSCMVAFLVSCFTLFPMRLSPMSFYAVIFTGLLLNITRRL